MYQIFYITMFIKLLIIRFEKYLKHTHLSLTQSNNRIVKQEKIQ